MTRWQDNKVNKFTKAGRTANERKMFEWTQKRIGLRRNNKALKEGRTIDLFYDGDDIYVFGRAFDGEVINLVPKIIMRLSL